MVEAEARSACLAVRSPQLSCSTASGCEAPHTTCCVVVCRHGAVVTVEGNICGRLGSASYNCAYRAVCDLGVFHWHASSWDERKALVLFVILQPQAALPNSSRFALVEDPSVVWMFWHPSVRFSLPQSGCELIAEASKRKWLVTGVRMRGVSEGVRLAPRKVTRSERQEMSCWRRAGRYCGVQQREELGWRNIL